MSITELLKDYPSNRKFIEQQILTASAMVLNKDKVEEFRHILKSASDEEFLAFSTKCIKECCNSEKSDKEILCNMKEMSIKHKTDGYKAIDTPILSDDKKRVLINSANKSNPSDVIYLTHNEDVELINLWEKTENNGDVFIPSDLFFAGTIPLMDFKVILDETECNGIKDLELRYVIFEDYKEIITNSTDEQCCVGVCFYANMVIFPIVVIKEFDSITSSGIGYIGIANNCQHNMNMQDFSQVFISCMETWYSIQIALLHPAVKEVFQNPKKEKVSMNDVKKYCTKDRKVKYIKKHIVNKDQLEDLMYGENKKHQKRHCLVWYVIGHWRTYQDGRKTFIQPYWKGALRQIKKNLDNRERELSLS